MTDFIINVITSVLFSGLLAGLLIWLSREWISARLKGSIQHEYDQKLEAHKAQLEAKNEVARLELKATIEREAAIHAVAHASFSEGQKAAMERKLNAIDRLWEKVLHLRDSFPSVLTIIDAMTVDEYKNSKDNPTPLLQQLLTQLTGKPLKETIVGIIGDKGDSIEKVRPYVGEHIWAIFYTYRVVMLRRLALFSLVHDDDAKKIEWHKDDSVRRLIGAVLTVE